MFEGINPISDDEAVRTLPDHCSTDTSSGARCPVTLSPRLGAAKASPVVVMRDRAEARPPQWSPGEIDNRAAARDALLGVAGIDCSRDRRRTAAAAPSSRPQVPKSLEPYTCFTHVTARSPISGLRRNVTESHVGNGGKIMSLSPKAPDPQPSRRVWGVMRLLHCHPRSRLRCTKDDAARRHGDGGGDQDVAGVSHLIDSAATHLSHGFGDPVHSVDIGLADLASMCVHRQAAVT